MNSAFRRWLEANASHKEAYDLAVEAWELAGSVRSHADLRSVEPYVPPNCRNALSVGRMYGKKLAVAASIAAAIVSAFVYFNRQHSGVSTEIGERRTLALDDGTIIALNTSTHLKVRYDQNCRHVDLVFGEALFDVAKNPKRPFTVSAGSKEVLAFGTTFLVPSDARETAVTLLEGRVQIDHQKLNPGERVTFARNRPPKIDEPQIEMITAWRRGEVVLDKTPLKDAIEEMNRYSTVQIVVESPDVSAIKLSGIFHTGDSARFANAVSETYHLKVDHDGGKILLSWAPAFTGS